MKILLTGATGFTGTATVPLLLMYGTQIRCFVRPDSDRSVLPVDSRVEYAAGDVAQPETLRAALDGVDALVNLVSLGFGHADGIIRAVQESGVKRAIFLSTTAIFTTLNPASKAIRLAAEQSIMASGLDFTILRPTMIYGGERDRNMWRLISYMYNYPVIPIFGDGQALQQPVLVKDVARAIRRCLSADQSIGKAYNIAGAKPLTYNQLIGAINHMLGHCGRRGAHKAYVPAPPVISLLSVIERAGLHLPIKAEQVQRLNEDKTFDYADAQRDFGYRPETVWGGITTETFHYAIKHRRRV